MLAGLLDGPVFYGPVGFRREGGYTVLLPVPASDWWESRVVVLPSRAELLVPALDVLAPSGDRPWWVIPSDRHQHLCTEARLKGIVRQGRERIASGGERP
ncbi:hypothetical protein AB0C52_24050 [Streptomyces sp. NPDC048717]|uniref:hypothetical protein n=1 Tax=Streptomyces sp. NPDC048717 TaxID=3154928 RepID=UPI003438867B